ncbi:hypothetical protein WDW86_07830 [Bdellovibrionota bacterium FG-2]
MISKKCSVLVMLIVVSALFLANSAMAMGKKKPRPIPNPAPSSSPTPTPSPSSTVDDRDDFQAMTLVRYLMVSETKLIDGGEYAPELLAQLTDEMKFCGLTFTGPLCLGGKFDDSGMFQSPTTIETSSSFIFLSLFSTKDQSSKFALSIEAEKNPKNGLVRSVTLFAVDKSVTDLEVVKKDFFHGRSKKLLEVFTPDNALEFAASELQKAPEYRKLYHFAQYIVNTVAEMVADPDKDKAELQKYRQIALESLRTQYSKITQSAAPLYQMAFLKMLRQSFVSEKDLLIAVSDELIVAQGEDVSQLAAITLAERDLKSDLIYTKVKQALRNDIWGMRRLAVLALNKIKSTTEAQLTGLAKHLSHSNYIVRQIASRFIGKISGLAATQALIPMLADGVYDVRAEAVAQLNSRVFTQTELPLLEANLKDANYIPRLLSVQFVGRIKSVEATKVLIRVLRDGVYDVRTAAVAELDKRQLSEGEVLDLKVGFGSGEYAVRLLSVRFTGKIAGSAATSALIPMLEDGVYDVRMAVASALTGRAFGEEQIDLLGVQLRAEAWAPRQMAAQFLGVTSSCKALGLLKARLGVEPIYDVITAIKTAIAAIQSRNSSCK